MWPAALKLVHDDTGHIAFDRSLQRLQARVIFPGMRAILRRLHSQLHSVSTQAKQT